MKVHCTKTEYMFVIERETIRMARMQGIQVKKSPEFKSLGSTVQSFGECGKGERRGVGRVYGWTRVSGLFCDRRDAERVKGNVDKTVVRPTLPCALETLAQTKKQEAELEVAQLKMLRFSMVSDEDG